MPSKKQQACVTRYVAAHYDKFTITAPRGLKEVYKQEAQKRGLSVNQLFIRAVEAYIADDYAKSDLHKSLNEEFLKTLSDKK